MAQTTNVPNAELGARECNVSAALDAERFERDALTELRRQGLRITMPRVQVIRALAGTKAALTPQAIHERILAGGGRIDVVSVYRILSMLENVGMVHHIGIVDGYFACRHDQIGAHLAQHLVCRVCGCVSEIAIPAEWVKQLGEMADTIDFNPSELRVEWLGDCSHCRKAG